MHNAKAGWCVLLIALFPMRAGAIAPKDAAYYCTAEAVGGLHYDTQQKKWASAHFRTGKALVLKLRFTSGGREKMFDWSTENSTVNRFNVTVTEAGTDQEIPCFNQRDYKKPVEVWDEGWIVCSASLSEIQFNPKNNRFMKVYAVGYLDGSDNNENTPSISGGVCTKIN